MSDSRQAAPCFVGRSVGEEVPPSSDVLVPSRRRTARRRVQCTGREQAGSHRSIPWSSTRSSRGAMRSRLCSWGRRGAMPSSASAIDAEPVAGVGDLAVEVGKAVGGLWVGEGKPAGGIVLAPELGRHRPGVGQLAAQPGSLDLGQLLEGGAEVRLLRCCNLGLSAELAALSPACSLPLGPGGAGVPRRPRSGRRRRRRPVCPGGLGRRRRDPGRRGLTPAASPFPRPGGRRSPGPRG